MRAVVQRVEEAKLWADGQFIAEIGQGLAVYVGFGPEDDETAMRLSWKKCVICEYSKTRMEN